LLASRSAICEVSGLKIVDCYGSDVYLGGDFERLVVNDVDVTAYVDAEQVNGEWSLVENQRHLLFAGEARLTLAIDGLPRHRATARPRPGRRVRQRLEELTTPDRIGVPHGTRAGTASGPVPDLPRSTERGSARDVGCGLKWSTRGWLASARASEATSGCGRGMAAASPCEAAWLVHRQDERHEEHGDGSEGMHNR